MPKNELQQRVIARLAELLVGPVEAAEQVPGLERNYIRDLVEGKKQSFNQAKAPLVAQALRWTVADLNGSQPLTINETLTSDGKKQHSQPETLVHNARIGEPVLGFSRVPIRGQTMGGKDGALIFNPDEYFGEVEAPPKLVGVPDAYAVYVIGDSMLERYQHGEVVYVHPYAPVKKDDYVVVQIQSDGQVHGWVKRFVSRDDKVLKVRQLNPKKILSFPANRVIHVHKIMMGGES
jgi:phage repressor protein C with HTH and peptisase S24 domain